jgi:hypothetical protein
MNLTGRRRWAHIAGILCQALVLGTLLFLSLARLLTHLEHTRIFRYEGF